MSDGKDDPHTRVSGSLGTMGVDPAGDGAGDPAGDVGGGIRLPSLSYAMVRVDDRDSVYGLYDIVEHVPGRSARIMATRVRYQCALEITNALNFMHLRRE